MRRLVGILLAVAVLSTAGQVSPLHTHLYADHDHPEHHHGLAVHEHRRAISHHDEHALTLESCDPGQHAVSFVVGCASLPHVDALDAELSTPRILESVLTYGLNRDLTDVRVHGPPVRTQASPRAPPLNDPA